MRVETGIAELCYFLGEKFDAVGGIAEDNGLIYLELRGQSVTIAALIGVTHLREQCI